VIDEAAARPEFVLVDVGRIANGVKRVEGNARRQRQRQRSKRQTEAERSEQAGEFGRKPHGVFEQAQEKELNDEARDESRLAASGVVRARQIAADRVVEDAGEQQRNKIDEAGGRIEGEPGQGKDPVGERGAAVKRIKNEGARQEEK